MMDLLDLRIFVRIADLGGITAAARSLSLPKSSVSRSLSRLEEAVGTVLIERTTRHIRLTDPGLVLRRRARRILDDVNDVESEIAGLTGEAQGDLNVTAPFTLAAGPIGDMMAGFVQRHPHLRVAIAIENRIVDIVGEEYDVAIRIGSLPDSALIARHLVDVGMWLCASPDYLVRSKPVTGLAYLSGHRLLSYGRDPHPWRLQAPGGALSDLLLAAYIAVDEPAAALAMLVGGAGIGLLPDFVASAPVHDGRLTRLLPDDDFGTVPIHALYPSHRSLSPKVRFFIDALIAHLR